jgi:polyisoprenoid-binding protein YceI
MKILKLTFGLMIAGLIASAQSTWSFDKAHSSIVFNVEHLVISEVTGKFGSFDGQVTAGSDDFEGGKVNFTVDVASINTDNERRDNHLKSDDFFNAEKFPKITFSNGTLEHVEGKDYKLKGDLTIRDVTKPVELDVRHGGTIVDPNGNTKAGFKVTGTINRFDYNMKFDAAMEAGGLVVGEDVEIVCNVELKKES